MEEKTNDYQAGHLPHTSQDKVIMKTRVTQIPMVTFLIDGNGVLTLSGELDLTRLGLKPGAVPSRSVFDMDSDNPAIIDTIKRALKGEPTNNEIFINGFTFANSYSPLFDNEGKVKNVIGVSFDITESRKAGELIRKSEFRLRTLFNSASDAIFTMNNRTFIDCNEATLRIFQCTKEQIVGQTPYRFSPATQPDGRPSEEAAMEKINAALDGVPQFFEWLHIRYDGTPFDAEVSLNRLDLKDEVLIQAIVRDVSERKRAERENKRLAMVANGTTNMLILADSKGRIQWVNPAFTRVTGYTLEEVVGKTPMILVGPGTDDQTIAFMQEMIATGQGFKEVEMINYSKEGKPYWVSVDAQPIYDSLGNVIQFIAIENDITERKATQQALLSRNEELSKTNAELDRFVYCASHDLRAPISSLLGLIEVARLEKDSNSIEYLLELQKKSLLRLDRFIKDIVDHSRNTRLQVESEPVNFEHMVYTILEQLQFMENVNLIRKVISIKQENEFYTAPTRLDIILNNLISNAIKYADLRKKDPYLEVQVKATETQTEIRVRDNGEGIPAEAQAKIFDMFYRASERGSGSGLGLYIVKEAIQKISGTITVHSEYGKGTEFVVNIPNLQH